MALSGNYSSVEIERSAEDRVSVDCTMSSYRFNLWDRRIQERTNCSSLVELAENDPFEAYEQLEGEFSHEFIDSDDWSEISPHMDGQFAFEGVQRYVRSKRQPERYIDEIEVVISVWRLAGFRELLKGNVRVCEEAVRFTSRPPSLA